MVFATVCDAVKTKIAAFVAGTVVRRSIDDCHLINKSRCYDARMSLMIRTIYVFTAWKFLPLLHVLIWMRF